MTAPFSDHSPSILAFDTASSHCAVALIRGQKVLGERCVVMAKGQAEHLLRLCQEVLDAAGVTVKDLDAIGVGIGPGNFTGIRIAVSAARGLALGLDIPAVGVSAFDALRFGADGPCHCCVDARRGRVYVQKYDAVGLAGVPYEANADEIADDTENVIGTAGAAAAYPCAVAIALIAATRYKTETARPAPLYLRPPDAAPARDAAPRILP